MVFFGVLAAAFYGLGLGAVWPPRDGASALEALLGQIGKSLSLSWFVVVISYWLDLPNLLLPLLGIVALSLVWQAAVARRSLGEPLIAFFAVAAVLPPCVALLFGAFGSDYRLIYMTGDALLSWNKWAVELASNDYHPVNGGPYPFLFPGLWSLVYKAQDTAAVWVIGKLTLVIVPAILVLLVFLLIEKRRYLHAVLLGGFIAQFFFLTHAFPMLLGDMDIPVCAMMLTSGVLLYLAADAFDDGRAGDGQGMTTIAAVFVGVASVTKQWGIAMALPLAIVLGVAVFRKHLTPHRAFLLLVLSLLPVLAFLAVYLPLQTEHPFGIIGNLMRISELASPDGDTFTVARGYVLGMLPRPAFAVIGILALANLLNLRRLTGWLGVAFALLGAGGFFLYAKCCTYDERNGWSVVMLFALAAFCGADALRRLVREGADVGAQSRRFPAPLLPTVLLLVSVAGGALASWQFSDRHTRTIQEREQWKVAGYGIGPLIRVNLDRFKPGDILLFGFDLAGWLPTMKDHLCADREDLCIDKAMAEGHRFFVLVGPGYTPDPRLQPYLTTSALIGDADGRALYGPIDLAAGKGPAEPSVIEAAWSGTPLLLRFETDACERMGSSVFDCGKPYRVQYDASTNSWSVNGPVKGTDIEQSEAYSDAPARPGHISIWGVPGVFDRWGSLLIDGVKVAMLSPAAT